MVQNRKFSAKPKIEETVFQKAVQGALDGSFSLREATITYGITKSTLGQKVTKRKDIMKTNRNLSAITYRPNYNSRQVFLLRSYVGRLFNIGGKTSCWADKKDDA